MPREDHKHEIDWLYARDRLAKKRKLFQLSSLPNQAGYLFVGVREDDSRVPCVILCNERGSHYIGGSATYDELIGWLPAKGTKLKAGDREKVIAKLFTGADL